MKKNLLEKFINKYNLSETTEAVKWQATDTKLAVHFVANGNGMVGFLETAEITLAPGDYNIYETKKLKQLLAVLGDDITVKVTPMALNVTDGVSKVIFALADPKSIPVVPTIKNLPPWDNEFSITAQVRDAFIKAASALSDSEAFAISSDGSSIQVAIGYEPNVNTTSVTINPPPVITCTEMKPVFFTTQHFREVLAANKEMPDTKVSVSSKGLLHIRFTNSQLTAEYYLLQRNKQN